MSAIKADVLENAVSQLSLVSAAMRMLLENCEIALLEAAEASDPGPDWLGSKGFSAKAPKSGSGRNRYLIRRNRPLRTR